MGKNRMLVLEELRNERPPSQLLLGDLANFCSQLQSLVRYCGTIHVLCCSCCGDCGPWQSAGLHPVNAACREFAFASIRITAR